jgi:hypothetical protein
MVIELNTNERDLLVTELEKTTIPELRGEIASGMRKALRDDFKKDEEAFKGILEKLKKAA